MKRILFTGGGTGGHIFPGVAVAKVLEEEGCDIIWIGASKGCDKKFIESSQISFKGIPTGKLRRYFSIENFIDFFKVLGGVFVSLYLLFCLKPSILFSKGGFVSVPPCIAAWLLRIPIVSHESDYSPGLATRIVSRFAKKICVSYSATASFFNEQYKDKIVYTGNPVRAEFYSASSEKGKEFIGYYGSKPILFVQGGSLGARQINAIVEESIEFLCTHFFVLHQIGDKNMDQAEVIKNKLENLNPDLRRLYKAVPFLTTEMPDVLAASQIVLSRAGANSLWECAVMGKPMVLIPLNTGGSRGDQIENATFFVSHGAATALYGEDASSMALKRLLKSLSKDHEELKSMSQAAIALTKKKASVAISNILLEMVEER